MREGLIAAIVAALAALALSPREARAQALAPPSELGQQEITPPRLVADAPAVYPEAALAAQFRDPVTVGLILDVDTGGAVTRIKVETPRGHGFDEAAVTAANRLRFAPALQGGRTIAARIRFRYVFKPPPPRLVGRVARAATDTPIEGARVTVTGADGVERATVTAADGSWSVADLPPGKVHVAVASPGRLAQTLDDEVAPGQETRVILRLVPEAVIAPPVVAAGGPAPLEVEVRGERPPREVTKRSLDRSEIALIPGTNGDALRAIQSLPGVARPPPFSGNLAVRGSAPQDTRVFVGGTDVPIVYHFGGLSSVVPTELLDKIDFFPGNYSTLYGRGTGGMIDIGIRDPKKDSLHGMAQLDIIDARVVAEGPIGGGFSFLVAGRRSWFDLWLGPVLKATRSDVTVAPRYYDYQVMIAKDIDAHSSFRLLFFGSDDALDILSQTVSGANPTNAGDFSVHTSFWRLQARYQNRVDAHTEIKVVAAVGQDINDIGRGSNLDNSTTIPVSARVELSERISRGVTANVGYDFLYQPYNLHLHQPPPRSPGVASAGPGDLPLETSASGASVFPGMYTEWELVPRPGTRIVPGVRADYASPSKTWDISPRLVVRQDLARDFPRTALKAGVGLFYQPPQPIEVDPVFGKPGLLDSRALQVDGGFEQELTTQLGLTADVFYKYLDRLIVPRQGNTGVGRAYGTEILLRYKADERFFGWLAYTVSRSEREDTPTSPIRLAQFDQTHILTVLGSYQLPRGVRVGARFQLVSGNLTTQSGEGAYDATVGANLQVTSYPPNGTRLPLFHQLDVRVDKVWTFKKWKLSGYLDVQNIYNYQAPEGTAYNYNFTQSSYVKGLPILPILGLRGEL